MNTKFMKKAAAVCDERAHECACCDMRTDLGCWLKSELERATGMKTDALPFEWPNKLMKENGDD